MLGKIDLRGRYHPCPAGEDRLPSAFKSSSVSFPALWAKQMDAWMDGVGVAIVTIIPWSSCSHLSFYHSWGEKPTARCRGAEIRSDLRLSAPAGVSIPLQPFSKLTLLFYALWVVNKIQSQGKIPRASGFPAAEPMSCVDECWWLSPLSLPQARQTPPSPLNSPRLLHGTRRDIRGDPVPNLPAARQPAFLEKHRAMNSFVLHPSPWELAGGCSHADITLDFQRG